MAKTTTRYVCQDCGRTSAKWLGRCDSCGAWGSMVEEVVERSTPKGRASGTVRAAQAVTLGEVDDASAPRAPSGLDLFDRVLGGGLVAGAATLLAGEPGIGKSTLLLQVGHAAAGLGADVLYVSAEESPPQLRLRAERLGCAASDLMVVGETRLESILAAVEEQAPRLLLVDSIQALRSAELDGPPGSIGQVRHGADRLVELCKARQIALFLVGHVTKDGGIAGPKSLEHLVDAVLTFEGEGASGFRVLRAQKNRFGPTGEVALFEMRDRGLVEVPDPSRVLLARRRGRRPGSSVAATLHGARPVLVEIQALVAASRLPSPRRLAVGLDSGRVTLLVAVLERFGEMAFGEQDLFLNVVGGLSVKEPAADLAVAAALISAASERPLPDAAFFGEVGLLGEVRPVAHAAARLREIAGLGFARAVTAPLDEVTRPNDLEVVEVEDLAGLAEALLSVDRA
ncbi:MAG: DNA repair protein RadA [Acidobacteriota bacterium]